MRGIVARRGTTGSTGAGGGDHDWLGGAGFEVRTEFFSMSWVLISIWVCWLMFDGGCEG